MTKTIYFTGEIEDTKINSVTEYLAWISSDKHHKYSPHILYYRGQSDISWSLVPGICRDEYNNIIHEHNILKKAEHKLWKELSQQSTYLEKLIYLQHFGMKTRLLDLTSNPLIALYFACQESGNKSDGVVYCGFRNDEQNDTIAEFTAKYVFECDGQNIKDDISRYAADKEIPLYMFYSPLYIYPPNNNPRIERQSGAFIMYPLLNIESVEDESLKNNTLRVSSFFSKSAVISYNKKNQILKELHQLGIDTGTIFAGVTDKIRTIMDEESWEYELENIIEWE